MNIGFYTKHLIGSLNNKKSIVYGDELYALSMCKALLKIDGVTSANIYNKTHLPQKKIDFMIYLNDSKPIKKLAKKHVLYLQNPYIEGSDIALKKLVKHNFDGYILLSEKIASAINVNLNHVVIPFGADTEFFKPSKNKSIFHYMVSFVGNDFKSIERTKKFLLPALNFNFGLFGKWRKTETILTLGYNIAFLSNIRQSIRRIKALYSYRYKKQSKVDLLYIVSRGKIPQQKVPQLYSNSTVNLNYTAQDHLNWDILTLRSLEIMACKGLLITDFKTNNLELSKCFVSTEGGKDLVKKIKYYSQNSLERKRISENGYRYVLNHASIQTRMSLLLRYLKSL